MCVCNCAQNWSQPVTWLLLRRKPQLLTVTQTATIREEEEEDRLAKEAKEEEEALEVTHCT